MEFVHGDIWESQAQAICVTTNGVVKANGEAVMGRGIALQAARLYPPLPRYLAECIKSKGNRVFYFPLSSDTVPGEPAIITFPTKHHWRQPSDMSLIRSSAEQLLDVVESYRLTRVALPFPGCSNGGLRIVDVVNEVLKPVFGADPRIIIVDYKVKDYLNTLR